MKVRSPTNIYEAFYPLNCLLKYFGLSVFSFDGPVADGKIATKLLDYIIFLMVCSGHLMIFTRMFWTYSEFTNSFVLNKGHAAGTLLLAILVFNVIVYQYLKRNLIKSIIDDLHSFDRKVLQI